MAQAAPPPDLRRDPAVAVDCVRCGACCFSPDARYISVHHVDLARMNAAARALVVEDGGERHMRMAGGRCAALRITVEAGGPRYRCAIYEARPDACRWLPAGGSECRLQREEKVERAQRAALALVR